MTTIKYVSVAMRVDNDGEGGILALMSPLGVKRHHRPVIIAFGLFGAALIYGDGAITPAISVWIRGGRSPVVPSPSGQARNRDQRRQLLAPVISAANRSG